MQRTVIHQFGSGAVVTDITGNIPSWCEFALPYAKGERVVLKEGMVVCQYFSHFLFFMELIEIDLHAELKISYMNKKTRLFLFMMLKNNILFLTPEGQPIVEASEKTCYATYNRKGEFSYRLSAGKHQFWYIIPRTAWLDRNLVNFPRLEPLLKSMKMDRKLFGHMSPCQIDDKLISHIKTLFQLYVFSEEDFEIELMRHIKQILSYYLYLLDTKLEQRNYLIKDYLDTKYMNPFLDNGVLIEHFFITEKTLIETFKKEFSITPYQYLIQVRLEKAKTLLLDDKMKPIEVYLEVGYRDFRSFSRQFKKHFGFPPSECR